MKSNINFGSKYKFKANDNPPPGIYDIQGSMSKVRPKTPTAVIREPVVNYRRPADSKPEFYDY